MKCGRIVRNKRTRYTIWGRHLAVMLDVAKTSLVLNVAVNGIGVELQLGVWPDHGIAEHALRLYWR